MSEQRIPKNQMLSTPYPFQPRLGEIRMISSNYITRVGRAGDLFLDVLTDTQQGMVDMKLGIL